MRTGRASRVGSGLAALGIALLLAGCSEFVELFPGLDAGTKPPTDGPDNNDADADAASLPDGGTCAPIHLGAPDPNGCAASIAAAQLRYALCTCDILSPQSDLSTQSMDSNGGPFIPGKGASVGTNRAIFTGGSFTVAGALTTADRIGASAPFTIAQTLRAAGSVQVQQRMTVGGDAWVGSSLFGPITIVGTLHVPPNVDVNGVNAGAVARGAVTIAPPCDCTHGPPITTLITSHAMRNDNARARLDADALTRPNGPRRLDLPCGEFYLTGIAPGGDTTIAVHGRAALFVDGPISPDGSVTVQLDPDAELDIVAGGGFSLSWGRFGDTAHPARVRLWLGTQGRVFLGRGVMIGALIHAPGAQMQSMGGFDLRGAALLRSLAIDDSRASITFDRALLAGGNRACGTPVQSPIE